MNDGERENFRIAWIERLITAAKDSGAKIPPPKRKAVTLETGSASTDPVLPPAKKAKAVVIVVDADSDPEHDLTPPPTNGGHATVLDANSNPKSDAAPTTATSLPTSGTLKFEGIRVPVGKEWDQMSRARRWPEHPAQEINHRYSSSRDLRNLWGRQSSS
ncbi:hypothetical protein B0H14DRAFT_2593887 [Mycena olivaceomarginata]|nr:hypothetical protein B0H14DRAFT_2593887 [Mycena olivaceomarginata]